MSKFQEAAKEAEEVYGSYIEYEDGDVSMPIIGFICPNCEELVHEDDNVDNCTKNWTICPVCEELFFD